MKKFTRLIIGGMYRITEIYLDAVDPYEGRDGKKIYIGLTFYAVFDGVKYIETSKGIEIDPDDEIFSENALYAYDYVLKYSGETIYYTNRVENKYGLAKRYPAYLPVNLTNGCVPAAGANIIGFYTRFFPELVPGSTPENYMGPYYIYDELFKGIVPVLATLSEYMGTNVGKLGTDIAGFKKGMTKFCNEKGRSIAYDSCMRSNNFDFGLAKDYFESGHPSVVFVNSFTVATLTNYDRYESVEYVSAAVGHAMAGFGYSEITYTLIDGTIRKDNYIIVATGLAQHEKGYFNINDISDIQMG